MQSELGNPINDNETPIFCKEHQAAGQKCYIEQGLAGINKGRHIRQTKN